MPIQIKSVSFDHYESRLITLFERYLAAGFHRRRFDWLYKKSPWGLARTWAAFDPANGTIVGAAAAFPRKFRFRGIEKLGWVLGDFCLQTEYRSLGPAVQLQRACLGALEPPFEFCYDFPSKPMMAIYKRIGVQQAGALVRWAKPLRLDARVEPFVKSKRLASAIGRLSRGVLASRGWKGTKRSCQIERIQGRCGEEFTLLDQELRREDGVGVERTSEYLNWRYLDCPGMAYEVFVARRDSSLLGYAVLCCAAEDARIVDLACREESGVIVRLIAEAVNHAKLGGAKTVHLVAGEGHPWDGLFAQAGFRRRENSPIIFVAREGADIQASAFCGGRYLMEGDRDS